MNKYAKFGSLISLALLLAGCDARFRIGAGSRANAPDVPVATDAAGGGLRPAARPAVGPDNTPKPVQTAHTAEQFDTTTSAQRAEAAVATAVGAARKLGPTVGSLGNPAEPGFWLKTPLVTVPSKGRVEYPANGKSVAVDLIPIDGPKTAGSRVSLAVLRLLGVPLTGLPDLIVFTE